MKNNDLSFNKTNFANLKKERDMLKITLQYITEENENLKNELNDMKITAKKNKDMLKEYVYQITNKDKLFEKMSSTIEQYKSRLKAMEQSKKIKKKYEKDLTNDFVNYNTNNHSTTTNSNNYTTNNIIATTGGENNFSFGFNILNNNNIKKFKKDSIAETNKKSNKSISNISINNKGFNILKYKYNENIQIKKEINNINNKIENKYNNKTEEKHKNDMKYFFEKQNNIMEEIDIIKDDIQFLMENKSKSKMKEKLNQSIVYNNSLNSSFCSEQRNPDNSISEKSLENSYLSNLSVTYNGPDPSMLRQLNYNLNISQQNINIDNFNVWNENKNNLKIKKNNYNLRDKYLINENFSQFINEINMKKEIFFLIDGKNKVWEIIPRGDLTAEQLQKYESEKGKENRIKSIINIYQENNRNIINTLTNNKERKNYLEKEENENLIDIKIKEPTDFLFK